MKEKGISLIEVIIAMTIIMIIITPVVFFLNKTVKVYHTANPSYKVFSVISDAMNEITDLLRQAKSVGISEETRVGFIIPINEGNDEMKIIFSADTDNYLIVREDDNGKRYVPYYNTLDTSVEDRVLLKVEFTYYNKEGNETNNPEEVRAVKVLLSGISAVDPEHSSRLDMINMVTLRNKK